MRVEEKIAMRILADARRWLNSHGLRQIDLSDAERDDLLGLAASHPEERHEQLLPHRVGRGQIQRRPGPQAQARPVLRGSDHPPGVTPRIVEAIPDSQDPDGLSLWGLRRDVPLLWQDQQGLVGLEEK